MNVVIYKRLSKEDKKRTQYGFDSQQADINHYLSSIDNTNIIGEFQEFISGGADTKPELEKAMELCRKQNATLVVAKLDRLSRRVSQIASYMESDIQFKVAALPQADNFQLHLFAALSEQERTMIRDRISRGLKAAKGKGVKLGGASEKWRESYHSNKMNHVSKSKHTEAMQSWETKRNSIQGVINMMKKSKIKLTYKNIADNLQTFGVENASGQIKWNSGQAHRAVDYLNISR